MLDLWIIEEIKKQEVEVVQPTLPLYAPENIETIQPEVKEERGIIVIDV